MKINAPDTNFMVSIRYCKRFLRYGARFFCFVKYHFSFRFVSFRFVSFRFVSFRFVSFRFVSFRFVSFRFVEYNKPLFLGCSWGVLGVFLGCSWGVQPVLGVFSLLETTFQSLSVALPMSR